MLTQKTIFGEKLTIFSMGSHIMYQIVCTNILHTSASSNCEWGISDLHKNLKICSNLAQNLTLMNFYFMV